MKQMKVVLIGLVSCLTVDSGKWRERKRDANERGTFFPLFDKHASKVLLYKCVLQVSLSYRRH